MLIRKTEENMQHFQHNVLISRKVKLQLKHKKRFVQRGEKVL